MVFRGKSMAQQEISLKVQEALQEEAYKGIVRIDAQTMRQIDVRAGDIIEIEGGRKTVGIVDRSYPSDIGQNIIRMDGILRRNAKTGIGENVKIRKVEVKEAKSITIAPAQQGVMIQANNELFKQGLMGRAVVKGDIISLGGARRRRRTLSGSNFDDIFNVFEEGFMGNFGFGSLKFIVAETNPKGAAIITENTEVKVSSKAVQVTEERVPDVTYEDIGGLEEEIKKLREMVELPIKNPEIFERLGVEPPKGVLLYGPPGTGKTLLAKAVANESEANFLLVNGPELTCVGGDTDVLTNPEGRVKIKDLFEEAKKNGEVYVKDEIKEIIIPKQPIKLFSVDGNLKVMKNEVKALTRLNAPSYYIIKTKKKGDLTTSKNHPLATLDAEGNLVWKRAEELHEGEYIAIASHIPSNQKNPTIAWWKYLDPQYTFVKINNKEYRLGEITENKIKTIEGIKFSSLKSNDERAKYIKPLFEITPLFGEFLGAMYSEGYIGVDEVSISGDDLFLQEKYVNYFKQLFGFDDERITLKKAPHGKVIVYSTILAELLTKGFGLPRHKKPQDEPLTSWLFQCNEETIAAFVRSYFNGDGNEGWKKENYPTPVIYSASKEFMLDMQILLLQLGIVSKVVKTVTGMGNTLYAVEVLDTEGRELFAKLIVKDYRKDLFDKWFATRVREGSSEVIPKIAPLLKKIKKALGLTYNKEIHEAKFEPAISGRFPLTYRNAKKLVNIFKKHTTKNKEVIADIKKVEKIVNADIKWDKIIEIKKRNEPTVLYDLTMKGPANYLGGSPLFLMHNSKFYGETEKRIRDLFEEAEKNAPSIIFIDEIDALAPKRDETYGEVERRMVSQLLCLDPKTPVYLKHGIKTIQELFESSEGETFKDEYDVEHKLPQKEVEVQAFTPEGRIKNTKIIALSKTQVPRAFTISLENGASITSSAITKFLSINNEGVEWKQVDKIVPEDYVFVPRKLMFHDHIQKIDLAKLKEKDKWVVELKEGIIKKLFKRNHILLQELECLEQKKMLPETSMRNKIINCLFNKEMTKEQIEKKFQITRKALNNYLKPLIKKQIVKHTEEKLSIQIQLVDLDKEIEGLARKENRKVYPLKKNYFISKPEVLDEDLAKLIGLVIADGHIGPYRVNLSGETSSIGREIYNRKFNKNRKLAFQKIDRLEMYSRSFSKLLEEYFDLSVGKKAYTVKVPEQFYNSPNSVKAAFLAGILEGDESPSDTIRFNTMSYDLAIGIARLLTSLGVLSRIKKYNTYVVQIAGGYESFEKLLEHLLPYLQLERKRKKLLAFLDRIKKVSRLVYPIKEGLKRVRDGNGVVLDDNMYRYLSPNLSYNINGNVLGYFVQKLGHLENQFVQEIKQIYLSDAVPCKVVSVEQGEGGVMYDLTTEYSNFIAGNIPVVLHNTVMDGLKSRGRVVVIGATNRPNSIDPALRRPGRFDREISIGVPNKAGRLNVLKIHTRNMPIEGPLDKEIMTKELLNELDSYFKENKVEKEKTEQQLNDLKLKKTGEKSLLDKLTNVITGLSLKIEKLEGYHELFIKKDKLNEFVIELSQIERNKEKLEDGEVRDILLEKKKTKLSENYESIIKDLKEFKIINSNFFNKIRDKSAKKELERLAEITHGFVGADLQALCKEAAMNVIRRVLPDLKGESEKIPAEILAKLVITSEDFRAALKIVRPSALREVLVERPTTTWDDVGGLQELKQQLKEAVEWPLKNPKMFSRLGIKPPRGILIYGPPGTGKTMLAKAVAHESEANFISVKGPEVLNKYVGESEKSVRKIFEKARQTAPTIIFFDEIDAVAPRRGTDTGSNVTERIVNTMLVEMDGLEELADVVVIAATNRPDLVDPSLLRPGRFDRVIAAPMPNKESRLAILKVHIGKMPLTKDVDVDKLAEKTEGYSGADIYGLVREAAMHALRKNAETNEVTAIDFEEALKKITPSLKEEDLKKYKDVEEKYLRKAKIASVVAQRPSYLG